jgi:hypothetical protein
MKIALNGKLERNFLSQNGINMQANGTIQDLPAPGRLIFN